MEYHVLQEEEALSPLKTTEFNKLKEANKNLKRQNLDLLEQLHHANSQQHALEASNQVCFTILNNDVEQLPHTQMNVVNRYIEVQTKLVHCHLCS